MAELLFLVALSHRYENLLQVQKQTEQWFGQCFTEGVQFNSNAVNCGSVSHLKNTHFKQIHDRLCGGIRWKDAGSLLSLSKSRITYSMSRWSVNLLWSFCTFRSDSASGWAVQWKFESQCYSFVYVLFRRFVTTLTNCKSLKKSCVCVLW